ncbi:MAG: response regulator [Oscillospiraceae bacterium]|jgi:CheY-like chemotaxis protein|nr:response regulator [Oscillospiraceae bacterium]
MDRDLKVLLIEDDTVECRNIIKAADIKDGIRLIGVTNSAEKATQYITDGLPDAIVLGIELSEESDKCIAFMQKLRDMNLDEFPYILVTAKNEDAATHDTARKMGADFIMTKQQENYSADNVIDFLSSVKSVILGKRRDIHAEALSPEDKADIKNKLLRRIHTELDLIGVSPKVVGRSYLVDGILRIMECPEPNFSRKIAAHFGKSVPSVERAMQTAITGAWKNNSRQEIAKYYTAHINPEKGIPTVTEFIYFYASKVKNNW